MVFVLVVLTVLIFIGVDYLLRKEEKVIKESTKSKKSPIFLSPEKALVEIGEDENKLYHISHTWALSSDPEYAYISYDRFMSTIFSSDIHINKIAAIGNHVVQGNRIWDLQSGNNTISQLSPLSGTVIEINPACTMSIPVSAKQAEKSWIVKLKPDNVKHDAKNLMNHSQAETVNNILRDELVLQAQQGNYLNDGGSIDPDYIKNMKQKDWNMLLDRFFPYHRELNG